MPRRAFFLACLLLLAASRLAADFPKPLLRHQPNPEQVRSAYAAANQLPRQRANKVLNERLAVHWLEDGSGCWFRRQLDGGAAEFLRARADQGKVEPAFDHARLAEALAKAAGQKVEAAKLPFDFIYFPKDAGDVVFAAFGKTWRCDLASYELKETDAGDLKRPPAPAAPGQQRRRPPDPGAPRFWSTDARSPDGQWQAFIKDHNVQLKPAAAGAAEPLTRHGKEGAGFTLLSWSPDSQALVALLVRPVTDQEVYLVQSAPPNQHRAQLRRRGYAQPGDPMTTYEIHVIPLADRKPRQINVEPSDFGGQPRPRWRKDGKRFSYEKTDRGHQRFRLIEVDAHTANARNLIDEKTNTFINQLRRFTHYLGDEQVIHASERSGWNHLYLVNLDSGAAQPITQGQWLMDRVERVDEEKKQIWFTARGLDPEQDPYFVHHCRINFDGTGLVRLTAANGTHTVQYSPDRALLVATWSRVDQPPVHELRRGGDGRLICKLAEADASKLKETGWKPPDVFVAKGRDGTTDIWGIVIWPENFDPARKYPVIENIYAGPQDSFVPKSFRAFYGQMDKLAALGFIVVQIDGMGTQNRSKAFHDVCWHNLADAGLPDRILWIKALGAKHPQVDLERIGIYGTSAGGQSSTGALLFHPDFYKVAVSSCGCHDNRIDKMWWNEQWMGYPVGQHYAEQSNITNAGKLRGNLMLIVGELDTNVPPESTYRLADALIKARKEFELVVIPGAGHTDGGPYGERKRQDFFVRHLFEVTPPNHNNGGR